MKLTNKELIRLKKEVFLLEHGFYYPEITMWYMREGKEEIIVRYGESSSYSQEIKREVWFREKFPEFFDEELKR